MKSDSKPCETSPKFSTLIELLRFRALEQPDRQAYTFLESERSTVGLTYRELDRRARALAVQLQSISARGERALLLYPPGLEFITAFFGCLYAGVIPVPAYPPRLNRNLLRVEAIVADATATVTMTTSKILTRIKTMMDRVPDLRQMAWLDTDDIESGIESAWKEPGIETEDVAFLQYTSGSTGSPKGVILSHGNLLHNASVLYRALNHVRTDKCISWLPTFHDMGFMAGVLQPLYADFPVVLMSPAAFLQSPIRWLKAITDYKATTSGGPNFAYDLCVRKIPLEQRQTLDLSSWRTAFNGAEPIRHETLERFVTAFEPYGFRREALYPCYGLAEATLIVSGGPSSAPPLGKTFKTEELANNHIVELDSPADENGRTLVASGNVLCEQEVVIVNFETSKRCAPDEVGEIWVSGPSVAQGYWKRPEETDKTFRARLADTGSGPFLRTGDLGFFRAGELFVAGRIKDLVIIRGRNHYPQDIELTVEQSHPALRPGCGAAFSLEVDDEERLVVVQEIENLPPGQAEAVIEGIRQAVSEAHELQVYAVVLVRPGSIPKTSSGKIQRHACRKSFLSRDLKTIESSVLSALATDPASLNLTREELMVAPESRRALLESYLQEQVSRVLKVPGSQVDPQLPIKNLGLDSLMSIELQYNIESAFAVSIPMVSFLQDTNLSLLAAAILEQLTAATAPVPELDQTGAAVAGYQPSETYPLSYGQQALWFLYHLAPESTAYNIARAVRIQSPLDLNALRGAFQQLVDRHPSLRTTFPAPEGSPLQYVHQSADVSFQEEDAAGWTEKMLKEQVRIESQRPFDLENGPLFRVVLYTRSQQDHVLLLAMHHIISDFWSLAVLMHELGVLYQAHKLGTEATLPIPATTYVDYVKWQTRLLNGAEGERLWSYWREQLDDGRLPALDLPTDRNRPPVQTYNGSSRRVVLSKQLTQALKSLGRAQGATLYMTLLAAFQTLLYRYTGDVEEVSVGSTLAGRSRSEFADVIGYFVNPVVMRSSISGDPPFEKFLERVRQTVLAAFEHQDYPFALLVDRLQLQRDPSRSPLFQVMFVLQKSHLLEETGLASFALGEHGARMALGELEFTSMSLGQRVAQFDLALMMADTPAGLSASLEYNSDLFNGTTITRMLGHFETLLDGIVAHPELRVSELPLLTEAETRQLLVEWNNPRVEYRRDATIHERFELQVKQRGESVALVLDEKRVSYREVDRRSNQLAHRLRRMGVGPEVRVGLLCERSVEMIVGMLGVLKAGGVYVPLEVGAPQERLNFMLEDSGCAVLLTGETRHNQQLPSSPITISFETDWDEISTESEENPGVVCDAQQAAYVIYTSGSTGRPKGVVVQHCNVIRLLDATEEWFTFGRHDVWTMFHSYGFDFSVWEVWGALLYGGRLVMVPYWVSRTPEAFYELLRREKVTVLNQTPSSFRQLMRVDEQTGDELALRLIIFGGEALEMGSLRSWYERHSDTKPQLVNMYGITETTVHVTYRRLRREDTERGKRSVIGWRIPDLELYILDEKLQPAPVGVAGEIFVGGAGLARGYLNRPELTAERFIPHPYSAVAGARLYRSGDRGRYLADGDIEYLGRLDHQVKVRGYRIETGEIEAALSGHEGVRQAVVLVREEVTGEKRLVAYVVPQDSVRQQAQLKMSDFRVYLSERLPEYMIPSAIVLVEELPLTSNGKIDRKALLSMVASKPETDHEYVGAKTEIEEILCGAWESVLGVERVGVHDNFFELGGDSILSIQLINRARQAGILLTPSQIFQHQTVARLAAVATVQRSLEGAEGAPLETQPVIGQLPLTPIQRWFFKQHIPNPNHWNQAILLETLRPLNQALLERALQELVSHHDALRLRFSRRGSEWQQFNTDDSERVSLQVFDLSDVTIEAQRETIAAEAAALQSSLDISRGPLIRAAYFCFGAECSDHLLLVIHHLGVDAVSWRILLEDLETAYLQLSSGEILQLAPKTTSYKLWAERLAEYGHSPELLRNATYWLYHGDRKFSRLPVDLSHGGNTEASTATVSISLNEEETRSLIYEVPAAYHSRINEVLLSALAQTLPRWAGGALPVELEWHGRDQVFDEYDTSRTVGWFTSIFPVMLDALEEGTSASALLKRVKSELRSIPQGGIGYGVLRYLGHDVSARAQLGAWPQAEVSFNYLGQLDQIFSRSSLFKRTAQEVGSTHDPQSLRPYLLEIIASVTDGRLQIDWSYSQNLHRRDTIEKAALEFAAALKSIIASCASGEANCYTPSDFPLARLDQSTLDQLAQRNGQLENIYPLSPVQRGMLFHTLYQPQSGVYVQQLSFRLRGSLDSAAFERAWQTVIQRHAILRTAFVWENLDEPLQLVRRNLGFTLTQDDCRGQSADEQQGRIAAYLETDRARGFELSEPPLMRMWLARLTDETYQFVWSFHHLLLDGWSLPIILKEVLSFYEASRQGRDSALPSSQPYSDYIQWIDQQDLSDSEAFWRRTLAGFTNPTPVRVDRLDSGQAEGQQTEPLQLDSATTAQLLSFARQHQLTLNTLLQGAWALLLSCYSGEQDVVFGATVSGRSTQLAGAERIVGPLINTVPVRVKIPAGVSVLHWLRALQADQAELRDYEHSPLVQIQGWSEVPRSLPLFQTIFVFENYPVDASLRDSRGSLSIDKVDFFEQTNYPLTMLAVPGEELLLKAMYDRQRFDAATVSRLLSHFKHLLADISANPNRPISQLDLISAGERRRLLIELNDTEVDYDREKCIHELIAQQAARTPAAVALVFEGQKLSYRELNERANRLAHHLRDEGIGPESLVGVLMERSVELVVALLGVLKAGGAYVPLDPAYPRDRLGYMLEDSDVQVLLTQEHLREVLPPTCARVINVDTAWPQIEKASGENIASVATADNLAYIIYTSGSTGSPKGAANTHGAILNRLLWMQDVYRLTPDDRILQKTPFSFDVSVWEFFWPLMFGAQLVVARPGGHQDNSYLIKLITEQRITMLHFVPSMLRLFLAEPGLERCESLRGIVCSGEALPFELQEHCFARLPGVALHNLYGPTEAAVDVTFWECQPDGDIQTVPIGRPVANTQIYLLDEHLRLTPEGIPGALHIGGVQLARGYHRRPELTAEKFIPDPFSSVPGARLYKTGDLARYGPNGALEFLGRIDYQVKVRGFRIELAEIESALALQPEVREAVVVTRDGSVGEKHLVAYVVSANGEPPSPGELRRWLAAKLPDYMIPTAIVLLKELPLTPNGKVDRKALPEPDRLRPNIEEELVVARTPIEAELSRIWCELLGLNEVGINDNFFALGGHSLLAMQLLSRLRQVFHVELPLSEIMSAGTIAEMARLIVARIGVTGWQAGDELSEPLVEPQRVVIPRRRTGEGPLPLSFAQQRLWFLTQLQPAVALYNCPAAVRLEGRLNLEVLGRALSEIIRRHEILRTNFPTTEDGQPFQRILSPTPLVPRVIDLRGLPVDQRDDEARRLMFEEARKPFDLTSDQLLRVTLFSLRDDDSILMLTSHHINVDAWSMGLLVKELATLYEAFSTNKPSPLPELPVQYADFALWQRDWLQGEVFVEQLRYWKTVLSGQLPALELPTDRPRPRQRTQAGERRTFQIDAELTAALHTLSRNQDVTLYMTLLAAFQTLLHRYTRQDDIIVGTAIANRPVVDVEALIGCFINTLALRASFSGTPRFHELLRQVREVSLGALSHQDLPFDVLVDELQLDRSLTATPLVQVAFGIQNSPMPPLELPGLTLTVVEVGESLARLDLTLWIEEHAGGLKAAWNYATDVFDEPTIVRMHAHYETLLRGIVANPTMRIDALEIVTAAEKEQTVAQIKRRKETSRERLLKVQPKSVTRPSEIAEA